MTVEKASKLLQDMCEVCREILADVHAFIGSHDLITNQSYFDKYPSASLQGFYDGKVFTPEEMGEIPFLKYRIQKYEMRSFPKDRINYSCIFEKYRTEFVDLGKYTKISQIKTWIESDKEILACFTDKELLSDYMIQGLVKDIIERYLFKTNATNEIPENINDIITPFVAEKLGFYLQDTLYFDIGIPLCLTTFAKEIKFDDGVELIKIPEDIQKSRQIGCKYEVAKENDVAACATHMIVLHNYCYKKTNSISFNSIIQDYSCYPLDKIDEIVGIIRVVTGYDIGYEHVLAIPNKWVCDTTTDLTAVYGAKSHFVKNKYTKMYWMHLPISFISETQCDEIALLYKAYQTKEKALKFSLMRLNRCMLRDEVDDMTTDACIGLESLLAGGAHTEITNAIASRIPFIFSKLSGTKYPPDKARGYMKKIYNLRSRIVHGDELKDKDIYFSNDTEEIYVPQMAVDFLRNCLLFMIKNPPI